MNPNTKKVTNRMQIRKKRPLKRDKTFWQCLVAAIIVTFIVYIPALSNGFLNWDDPLYVTQNKLVLSDWSMDKLKGIFSEAVVGNYHPITMLSLAIDHTLFGKNAFGFHLVNVLMHVANVGLLFWFMYLFTRRNLVIAFLVAVLFGIHPMHVESVAWISERKDVLYVLFFLAGLIAYLQYVFSKQKEKKYYVATLVLFVFSVLSKPAAVVFPVVLVLIDFYLFKRWRPKMLQNKIVFFIISIIIGIITIQTQDDADAFTEMGTFYNRILFACYGFNMYLAKLFVPFKMSALYPYPIELYLKQSLPLVFQVSPVITLGILAASMYSWKYFKKTVLWGVAFYLVTVALVLQLVSVGYAIMADRYTYLPYVGIFFVLAWLFHRYFWNSRYKHIATGILAVYMVAIGMITWQRCQIWDDGETLFSDVLSKYPEGNPVAYYTRGNNYFARKQYEKAIADFSEAIAVSPNHKRALANRGDAYKELKQYNKALEDYNQALKSDPSFEDARLHRADLNLTLGKTDRVLEDANIILQYSPNNANAYNLKAGAYFQKQQLDLGLKEVNKALQIRPKYADALLNRAILYSVAKNHAAALNDYNLFLQLKPNDIKAYLWRGISHRKLQNWKAAKSDFDHVIANQPNNGEAYRNRFLVFQALGEEGMAVKDDAKARSLGF